MNKQHDTSFIRACIDYIIESELDDYQKQVDQYDWTESAFEENNHIYAKAMIASLDLDIIEETHERVIK